MGYEQPSESPSDAEPEITSVTPAILPTMPVQRYMAQPQLLLPPPVLKVPETQPSEVDSAFAKGRHEIRRLRTQLEERTKIAGKMEADRRERIKKLHEKVVLA